MTTQTMSSAQLAEYLGVAYQTIYRWRQSGYGPAWMRMGSRMIRYKMTDVEEWEQRLRDAK